MRVDWWAGLLGGLLCGTIALSVQPAEAQPTYEVVGAQFEPFMLAVPKTRHLGGPPAYALRLTETLRRGARLVRMFELVPVKSYLDDSRESASAPRYRNWANVGSSGLITSTVESSPKGPVYTLRFFDVEGQKEVLGRKYSNAKASEAAYRFLDEVLKHLGGDGVFSSKIAYVRRTDAGKAIFVANIDGTEAKRLTDPDTLSVLPSWSRSGRQLYFTSYLKGNPDLYRMDIDSRKMTWLSHRRGLNTGAAMAPNGKRIALTLTVDGNTEIYAMGPQGGGLTRLTNSWGQDISATWSPDGRKIAFVSSRSGQPHIYVMGADGSGQRRLTFKGDYNQEPDWSPAAKGKIVFTARDRNLSYDIFLVDPESGDLTRLTQNQGTRNESPSFSPDGQQILFVSNRGGRRALYVMDVDGRNQRRITRDNAVYEDPSWGPSVPWN